MSAGNTFSEVPANESGGTLRTPCPLHGCKRIYCDRSALDAHIKDHDSPAQSLPGQSVSDAAMSDLNESVSGIL